MKPYCVYLTIYRGNKNKMPPFYIGSSSVDKINTGYHGSVSSKMWKEIWESEIKDNPHLFESKIICTYNTRQEATDKEYKFHKYLNVVKNPLYINQAMAKKNGHFGRNVSGELHPMFGKRQSVVSRAKSSKSHTGKTLSEETKKKIGISSSGRPHTDESKLKLSSAAQTGANNQWFGKFWMNNNIVNQRFSSSDIIPEGWSRGMIKRKGVELPILS